VTKRLSGSGPDAIGTVNGVARGMGVNCIRWVVIVEGKGSFGVNLGCPTVTNGYFATRLFSNYFGRDLLIVHVATRLIITATDCSLIITASAHC